MHDLDRTMGRTSMESGSVFEFEAEDEYDEAENFEYNQEESSEVFGEEEVAELAAELLSVSNQQELDNFLSGLVKKAGKTLRQAVNSPLGRQIGGVLRSTARHALPAVGSMIGNAIVPGAGGVVGGKLASAAGSLFGLEMEGLTQEDSQYEVAKQFVRFGGDTTKRALALAASGTPIPAAAKKAAMQAAERYVPGLLNGSQPQAASRSRFPQRGSWTRQGSKLVIHLGRE